MSVDCVTADVSGLSSVGCGKVLKKAYFPSNIDEILQICEKTAGDEIVFLGSVSNTLVLDEYGGAAVFTSGLKGVSVWDNQMTVCAGESLSKLSETALSLSYGGLENFYGIPGTIGGAVSGNSGCFGKDIGELIRGVTVFNFETGETEELDREEIAFSYRKCNLKKNTDFIVSVTFDLYKEDRHEISEKMAFVRRNRALKQPKGRSLGSYFKQYNGVSAGYYIEKAGLKGVKRNGVRVSEKHANFLINESGSAGDYYDMGAFVAREVYEKLGIKLEREVIVVGEENRKRNRCGRAVCAENDR